MRKTDESGNHIIGIIVGLKDAVFENKKIVLPVILVAAILITMGIGMAANRKNEEQEGIQTSAPGTMQETAEEDGESLTVPDVPLEENAYPEVNELMMKYFKALEENNPGVLTEIASPVTEKIEIYFTEWAKHIESCPIVNIYTKPGPREDSFLAYVVADLKIVGYEETLPGLISFYVCRNEAGNYYINVEEEIDKAEAEYIEAIDMQEDVADLNNKVNVEFKQLVSPNSDAADAFMNVDKSITKGVQEELIARQEAEAAQALAEEEAEQSEAEQSGTEQPTTVATEAKATAVVNMRSSDSEMADKLGKAEIGDTFQVLEQRANGWTKLTDGTQEFFVKSEFLEITAEAPAAGDTAPVQAEEQTQGEPEQTQEQTAQETSTSNKLPGSNGYVTATTTVNVRKSASETGERLGTIYMGDRLELVMNQADGWTKVKYEGQTAYVKSEFLE